MTRDSRRTDRDAPGSAAPTPAPALAQSQFLTILPREEALDRWLKALDPKPLGAERVSLAQAHGRVSAEAITSPIDNPPFDRALVDGFAVRAEDVAGASERQPAALRLNFETIACGHAPEIVIEPGTATPIATGAPLPRGADAVVMIEWTDPGVDGTILIRRAVAPGASIGYAAGDIASGETLLRAGHPIGSREIAMLAACGLAEISVWRRPRIAVISTGDELVSPGDVLPAAAIYDSNGPAVAAALRENGCEPTLLPALPDDPTRLEAALAPALAGHDGLILSAGTSKGAGDLTYALINALGAPGIIAHGVALKPGKPLCLAVCQGKPVVALPGFPTSAMFTFHDMVAPVLRRLAGLPQAAAATTEAELAVDVASELGRREFVMVALLEGAKGLKAFPTPKGSGAVTSFTQADGFLAIPALTDHLEAGERVTVTRFGTRDQAAPDLAIIGSHCIGLEILMEVLARRGLNARLISVGSQGGLAALARSEADIAPIHLLDPASGTYNAPFLGPGMRLVRGWERAQGLVHRTDDARFAGMTAVEAMDAALGDPACLMVNRNPGSGTRVLIDRLLAARAPANRRAPGYANAPRSHNAVAASVAQGRADWGVAIAQAAHLYGLGFIEIGPEAFDFAVAVSPRRPDAVARFEEALRNPQTTRAIEALGFRLASPSAGGAGD